MPSRRLLATLLLSVALICTCAFASEASVATTWRLLDYIAVDYREAVAGGGVCNPVGYDEMLEYSATAAAAIEGLPQTAASEQLKRDAGALRQAIVDKAEPDRIAVQARGLAASLVQAYPIPLMPASAPQHARGQALYAQLCASCHGPTGAGDGPASVGLDPPPIDFTDRARADERSVFALYQVIEQGLEGTSMISYRGLPPEDLWALATYSGSIAYPETLVERGRTLLERDPVLRAKLDLERYVSATPADLAQELGSADNAAAIVAYLRRHPEAAQSQAQDPGSALAISRGLLRDAMAAYRGGRSEEHTSELQS